MFCFKLIDTSQGSTHKEGIRKVVTGAEVRRSSFIISASRSRGSKSKKFLFKGLAFMIKELKEFRCKCKQFPPYELLGFASPPIVKSKQTIMARVWFKVAKFYSDDDFDCPLNRRTDQNFTLFRILNNLASEALWPLNLKK